MVFPHSKGSSFGNDNAAGLLEANLEVLRNRWPHLTPLLVLTSCFSEIRLTTETPETTLFIDGIHLGSGYDKRGEAAIQGSLIPTGSPTGWIYGIGTGDLPRTLLKRENLRKLQVVILNPAVTYASFCWFDHRDWLSDPRTNLLAAGEMDEIQRPFAAIPSCLHLADNSAARLRDLVVLELATPFIREKHGAGNADLKARIEDNLSYCLNDDDAGSLFGLHSDKSIIVAAAGPTLADSFNWIKEHAHYPLIAVDSALKPLAAAGIVPDAVVAVDAHPENVLKLFTGFDMAPFSAIPMIYFPCVHPDVLKLWPGPRLTAYPEHPLYQNLAKRCPKQTLFSSGSVLHPAVDLAAGMGASEIILLGADFAYPGGKSHVTGAAHSQSMISSYSSHWVLDGNGKRISTSPNLRGFLRDLEGYIRKHPEIRFLNGSRKGAGIAGTFYMELPCAK